MIFITSSLELNGCTTFILRVCREMHRRDIQPTVVVLFESKVTSVSEEISQIARVINVKSFLLGFFSFLPVKQFNVFLPLNNQRVMDTFSKDLKSIHVMGVFGLIFAKRLSKLLGNVPVTIGIYHQNEFYYDHNLNYFHRWIFETVSKSSFQNMIFFNEANQRSYANHFNSSFLNSIVLPIGIELPNTRVHDWSKSRNEFLIVSVGNLLEFKTYNRHVISCLPRLRIEFPDVRYEIYGEGYQFSALKDYAVELGVEDLIEFCGHLDYRLFNQVVSRAHVFVGSGTAILESAALGVPSIIGIESIRTPDTYGLISDVPGYSYNELGLNLHLVSIQDSIVKIFNMSPVDLLAVSSQCIRKAREFDVETLVNGLLRSESIAIAQNGITFFNYIRLFISFFWVSLNDFIHINRSFRFRSNQSQQSS